MFDFRISWVASQSPRPRRPDPVDVLPDPDDLADFEQPDQQALIDVFLDGLCKKCDHPDAVFPF
jgi:hypothetical protein